MRGFLVALGAFIVAALIAAATWLWTPSSKSFDTQAALEAAAQYSADVIRDDFGVPHIYGEKNADVAFGLAYAHAEDDWATFEDVILFTRGDLAQRDGRSGAITDYLVAALGVKDTVDKKYSSDLSTGTRAIIEAYAAGANYFCATHEGVCAPGIAPVTYADVAGGFVARQPFFYGLDDELTTLLSPPEAEEGTEEETAHNGASANKRYATNLKASVDTVFHLTGGGEFGSNAIAISPKRSADGATRLMVNSHQPYTGPVAWYEARLKSEEGWDGIGGFFPGSPFILHGALPKLAWAFTVNKPDLVDVYDLEVDREKNPDRYRFDGEWRDFDVGYAEFRVKLWGPLSLPVKRRILRSVHGPVFETPNGWKAVAFAGDGTITAAEQYYQMNIAETYAEWRSAFEILGIPSLNAVYADDTGRIGYFYNAAIPVRDPDIDWTKPAPGDASSAVWSGVRSFGEVPQVVDPDSGFVGNANNSPFEASAQADVPRDADFPQEYGIDRRTSNRGDRLLDLYLADDSITEEEFIAYKMDTRYHEGGRVQESVELLIELANEAGLTEEATLLSSWDLSSDQDNRAAALSVLTVQAMLGTPYDDTDRTRNKALDTLREMSAKLKEGFGRIDPEWGEVNRLIRGNVSLPLDGGPDTLRAVYSLGDPAEGPLTASFGDTYVMSIGWDADGQQSIKTIHQFGSATLDETSPHYADQAKLFAKKNWKEPAMDHDALMSVATRTYKVPASE